ncbi:MAG TPA: hypothetical protein VH482_36120, partial [Thermomicrobiales bacterium]
KDRGRSGSRRRWAAGDPAAVGWAAPGRAWPGLRRVVAGAAERRLPSKTERGTRCVLSSRPGDARAPAAAVRRHRGIENRVRRVRRVPALAVREDDSRVRAGHAAENLAVPRRLARNLRRQERTATVGTKAKRLTAARDTPYPPKALAGCNAIALMSCRFGSPSGRPIVTTPVSRMRFSCSKARLERISLRQDLRTLAAFDAY